MTERSELDMERHTRVRVRRDVGALECLTPCCVGYATHGEVLGALGLVLPARRGWRR